MKWPRALVWLGHEFLEMLPAVIFFAVGFNVIVLTTNLILSEYALRAGNFLLAITGALVVGKAVLVANATAIVSLCTSSPTYVIGFAMTRLLCMRLGTGPSGTTLEACIL